MSIKGFQGVWRWAVDLGGDIGDLHAITSHECAVFLMTSFVFSLNLLLFQGDRRMLLYTVFTFPTSFITFIYAQRRVAYGCLAFGFIMTFLYLPKRTKKMLRCSSTVLWMWWSWLSSKPNRLIVGWLDVIGGFLQLPINASSEQNST